MKRVFGMYVAVGLGPGTVAWGCVAGLAMAITDASGTVCLTQPENMNATMSKELMSRRFIRVFGSLGDQADLEE
jgi:hypothetical protein